MKLKTIRNKQIISSLELNFIKLSGRYLATIEYMWTDEAYRKQGYATKLIQKAIGIAKGKGCDCIELTVREDRPDLQEFYKSFGFFDRCNRAMRLKL